jgi:hypothetical protein
MFGVLAACAEGPAPPEGEASAELGLGVVEDMKDDGNWGFATTCKPIPALEPLADPMIVVSLDGLTLRLFDRAGTYDRTFPIGPGAIEKGVSLTPVSTGLPTGLFHTRTDQPVVDDGPTPSQAKWAWNHRCRMWWKDEQGKQIPVFAGLPFIRLEGPPTSSYAIHGPVDRFTQANGGTLRRGYVSHGCIRMDAADVVEVWALIQGHRVPVRVQQAVERRDDDTAVDISAKWIGQECARDADCNYLGGMCHMNAYSGRGFCTARCNRTCNDRAGYPPTFCVADPSDTSKGLCVPKSVLIDNNCRRYDHFVPRTGVARFKQPSVKADVCLPGSEGWVGDRCLADSDCPGGVCAEVDGGTAGVCTRDCTRSCPDKATYAGTFCVAANESSGLDDGMCVATCSSNDDCAVGTTCEREPRNGQPSVLRNVCLPY